MHAAKQITTGNETIEDVDVSSDGRWLVFDSDRGGNADLYVMPSAGGEARQITTDPAGDWSPDWSPDGRLILFHSMRGGNRDIYTVEADGTGLHKWNSDSGEDIDPDWAPDGKTILWEVFGNATPGFKTLRLVDGAQPTFIPIPVGDFAHWSPDGSTFLYHALDGIRVRRLDNGVETLVASDAADSSEAYYGVWSLDGKRIYYLTRSTQGWTVRVVAAGGGPSSVVVNFDDPTRQQTKYGFCTDGKLFYFTVGSPESDIWVAELSDKPGE